MYCSLNLYLEKKHPRLQDIIHNSCLEDELGKNKSIRGITFIIPPEKVISKLEKVDNPSESREILGRYILYKVFSEADQFILKQNESKIYNKNNEVMLIEKISDNKIKINKTCEVEKVDVDVYRAAVWEVKKGELDRGEEKIERKYTGNFEPSPRESAKTIWHECINNVNAALRSRTMSRENPIISAILSIAETHKISDFVSESPVATLYSVLKPNGQSSNTMSFAGVEIKKHDPSDWPKFLFGEKKKYTFDLKKVFTERERCKKDILDTPEVEEKFKKLLGCYEKIAPEMLISEMTPNEKLWQDFVMFFVTSLSAHAAPDDLSVEVFSRIQQVFGLLPGFDVVNELREQLVFTNTDVAVLAKQNLFDAFLRSDAFLYTIRNLGMNDSQHESNLLKYGMGFDF